MAKGQDSGVAGILNLNKPVGMTSHDAVAVVRRLAGTRRVGHAGTLDPAAEGVLPLCLGKATRVVEYLSDAGKTYRATIALGLATASYDLETPPSAIADEATRARLRAISRAEVGAVLAGLLGPQQQLPPMYSAVQVGGQRLYDLARAGKEIERASRPITIYRLDLLDMGEREWPVAAHAEAEANPQPQASSYLLQSIVVEVECSKGTYIRSLAVEIGAQLGTPAVLAHLLRTRSATFRLEDSYSLQDLSELAKNGRFDEALLPTDYALQDLPRLDLDAETERRVKTGLPLPASGDYPAGQLARAYAGGQFVAILRQEGGQWRPEKVFNVD